MPDSGDELRSPAETFTHGGCHVTVADPAGILAAARTQRIQLLHAAAFPAPVRHVSFSIGPVVDDQRPTFELQARISAADPFADRTRPTVLGRDPIGLLLARRLAAGDPWAARLVDGLETATAGTYRRLGLDRPAGRSPAGPSDPAAPPGPAIRDDEETGLRATVTHDAAPTGGIVSTVRAVVPLDLMTPAHLRSMFRLVLDAATDLCGDARSTAPFTGRRYVLSHRAPAGPTDPERAEAARAEAERTEAERTDRVTLEQVGGLGDVVAQFRQIAVSFKHPEVMARWGARRPQGILMYGPPGTGKTMLARALANEIGADFREVRTPEILDKWLGASERNIKRIFREARRYRKPTVLLFDEFDSIISYAGMGGDAASQAVNAVAGIFKQEMNDLIEDNPNVIVVATTNFPHRVDDSLIRSGRFDVKLAIPLPDEAGRAEIFGKMIRELTARHEAPGFRMFADDVDPADLARVSHGMTGADVKEVLRRVQLAKAMQEARSGVTAPPISQDDLRGCLAGLRHTAAAR